MVYFTITLDCFCAHFTRFHSEHSKITNKTGMRFNYNFVSLPATFYFFLTCCTTLQIKV